MLLWTFLKPEIVNPQYVERSISNAQPSIMLWTVIKLENDIFKHSFYKETYAKTLKTSTYNGTKYLLSYKYFNIIKYIILHKYMFKLINYIQM